VHVLPLGETASLVVRYRGDGSGGRPIDLIAHMDVVTANRAEWQRDPYRLIEENGYFFGRGTADVKQEVALLTTTFLSLKARGYVPKRDLIIAFSGDEETAQATARDLVTTHRDLVDAEFALNGDGGGGVLAEDTGKPQVFYVQGAEKSSVKFVLTTHNPGGHSSMPRADNAIYDLADALEALRRLEFPVQWNEWTLGDCRRSRCARGADSGFLCDRRRRVPQCRYSDLRRGWGVHQGLGGIRARAQRAHSRRCLLHGPDLLAGAHREPGRRFLTAAGGGTGFSRCTGSIQ